MAVSKKAKAIYTNFFDGIETFAANTISNIQEKQYLHKYCDILYIESFTHLVCFSNKIPKKENIMSNYGKIQFVDYYCEAPQNARFILRSLSDDSWVLQEYQQNTQRDLAYFPSSSCYKENFSEILETCRKIVKSI